MGLGIVGVVLAILALVGPWWTMSMNMNVPGESFSFNVNYGLFGSAFTMSEAGTGTISRSADYSNATRTGSVFLVGMGLTVAGLALGSVMILLVALGTKNPAFRKIGAILGVVAFLALLGAALYVMTALVPALTADAAAAAPGEPIAQFVSGFWGSQSISFEGYVASVSYGGGWGWFLALIAGIFLLLGGMLAARTPRPAPAPQGWTQAPGPYAPQGSPPYPSQPHPPYPYPPQAPPPSPPAP